MEEKINLSTLNVLNNIATDLKFKKIIMGNKGVINFAEQNVDYGHGDVIAFEHLNKEEIEDVCISIYQHIPSERLIFSLGIELWKKIPNKGIEKLTQTIANIKNDAVVSLTTMRGYFGLVPESLAVYSDVDEMLKGNSVINMSLDCDYWEGGMKGVIIMLYGYSRYVIKENVALWFCDIYNIADNFNPNL